MSITSSHERELADAAEPEEEEQVVHGATEVADDSSGEDYASYRSLSPAAVLSCVLGLGALVAFFDWWLVVIPVLGLLSGAFALRQIAARSDELAGRVPALAGMALSAVCLVGGQTRLWYIRLTEVPDGHVRITYDDLQPDPRVINQPVPPSAEEFHGQRVFIKGY